MNKIKLKKEVDNIIESEIKSISHPSLRNKLKISFNHFIDNENELIRIKETDSFCDIIYKTLSKNRVNDFGNFYHFKDLKRTIEIINTQKIKLYPLPKHNKNDNTESLELLRRYWYGLHEKIGKSHYEVTDHSLDDNIPETVHIFCLTKDFRNEMFWQKYANNDNGVCINFEFEHFNSMTVHHKKSFEFRDVFYDDGYTFDFLQDIRFKIENIGVKYNIVPKSQWFKYYFKRKKYSWENETRISINFQNYIQSIINSDDKDKSKLINEYSKTYRSEIYDKENKTNMKPLCLELDNDFFKMKIVEIICGKNISNEDYISIRKICAEKKIKIWKRQ